MTREVLDRDHLQAVAHLRQLVLAVGELPARSVTSQVVTALVTACMWLEARNASSADSSADKMG